MAQAGSALAVASGAVATDTAGDFAAAGGYLGSGGVDLAFTGFEGQGPGVDPVLAGVPAARRHALTATRDPLAVGVLCRFDI